jgi:DNA-binding TFAR19-related protein (PDSD5 family)
MQTKIDEMLQKPLIVINLGLKEFAESLEEQEVEVIQVDWVPPAGGDKEMMDLLEQIL